MQVFAGLLPRRADDYILDLLAAGGADFSFRSHDGVSFERSMEVAFNVTPEQMADWNTALLAWPSTTGAV